MDGLMRKLLAAVAALLILSGAGGVGAQYYYRGQIFRPLEDSPDPESAPFPVEVVSIATADGLDLNSWWHPPAPGQRTILYLHGNAQHVGNYVRGVRPLADAGYGVLMLDYRGYGGNPGALSDEGLLIDGRAALDWLAARGIASETVVLYGYSLGTGVAVPLAAERAVAGVILAAPFASIADMGYELYPRWFVDLVLTDRFDSLAHIADVEEPVLMFHGTDDRTVPIRQSARLANAGGSNIRRVVIEDAGHGWELFEPEGNSLVLGFLAGLDGIGRS